MSSIMTINSTSLELPTTEDTFKKTYWFESMQRMVKFSNGLAVMLLIVNVFIFILTITGNLVVILLVKVYSQLRVPANYMLASLAVIDVLSGLILQLTNIDHLRYVLATGHSAHVTNWQLNFLDSFGLILLFANVANLCLITFNRYIAIHRSLRYVALVTTDRVKAVILTSWLIAIIVGISTSIIFPLEKGSRILTPGILLIGAGCMVALYIKIHLVSRKHTNRIKSEMLAIGQNIRKTLREQQGLRTVACICTSLLVSYLPLFLLAVEINLINTHVVSEFHLDVREVCRQVGHTLLFLKSAVNPLLYFFRNSQARFYTCKMLKSIKQDLFSRV